MQSVFSSQQSHSQLSNGGSQRFGSFDSQELADFFSQEKLTPSPPNPFSIAVEMPCSQSNSFVLEAKNQEASNDEKYSYRESYVLQQLVERARPLVSEIDHTLVVVVAHVLDTTVLLFDGLRELGVSPEKVYLLGKHYSVCYHAQEKLRDIGFNVQAITHDQSAKLFREAFLDDIQLLWQKVLARIQNDPKIFHRLIVFDDGGLLIQHIPETILALKLFIIAIEQTTAGLREIENAPNVPTIMVGASADKKQIESGLIADSISNMAAKRFPGVLAPGVTCGIIGGAGNIGRALEACLNAQGIKTYYYDTREGIIRRIGEGKKEVASLEALIKKSHYIFGATGHDVFANFNFKKAPACFNSKKVFINCSSAQQEWPSLLRLINRETNKSLRDIGMHINGQPIIICRGGYPINFDSDLPESSLVNIQDILLTRGLLLSAFVQALFFTPHRAHGGLYILDPFLQKFTLSAWLQTKSHHHYSQEVLKCFDDIRTIVRESCFNGKGVLRREVTKITHQYFSVKSSEQPSCYAVLNSSPRVEALRNDKFPQKRKLELKRVFSDDSVLFFGPDSKKTKLNAGVRLRPS